jgi:hypothetical protein
MFGQNNNQDQQQQWQPPQDQAAPAPTAPMPDPVPNAPLETTDPAAAFTPFNMADPAAPAPQSPDAPALPAQGTVSTDDLLSIKQDALQQLSPLVGHLEQSAEEKFRTTMMMIQASDDHSLLQSAYEAAKQITDEKARAQALLDVVNEINYFTQQHDA